MLESEQSFQEKSKTSALGMERKLQWFTYVCMTLLCFSQNCYAKQKSMLNHSSFIVNVLNSLNIGRWAIKLILEPARLLLSLKPKYKWIY